MLQGSINKWIFLLLFIASLIFSIYYFFYRNIQHIEMTPPTETLKQDLGKATEWLQKGGKQATEETKKAAESVHKAVKSAYHSAADALSAVTNARTNLEAIATTIETLPKKISDQTISIEQLPDQLDANIRALTDTITYIKQTQKGLSQQATDINTKLETNTVPEIVQLNKSLGQAFKELEKALSLLAATKKEEGILYDFKNALIECKQEAQLGKQDIESNIKKLDEKINHPTDTSAGYLTLPDRIRAVAAVFNPFAEQ